jgi:hypothetical protein
MTEHAKAAHAEAEGHVPPQKEACKAQLRSVLHRLGDHDQVRNTDLFKAEGDGIFAAKARCGLRAYGWFDRLPDGTNVFIVAQATMKKKQKADPADIERVVNARQRHQNGEQL